MRSELITEKDEQTPTFPALYKSIQCGAVVLFTSTDTGMVVKESKGFSLGEFEEFFISCTDPDEWQRLPTDSQVILTQE
jgi:hypothetical protein